MSEQPSNAFDLAIFRMCANLLAGSTIPQLDGLVEGSARYKATVWRKYDVVNELHVTGHTCHAFFVLLRFPQYQREIVRTRYKALRGRSLKMRDGK